MLTIIIAVVLAHLLGDYPLQGTFLATMKSKSRYILFVHCFIWSGLVFLTLSFFGLDAPWKFFFLLIVHYLVDYWKCHTFATPEERKKTFGITMTGMQAFFIDQSIHVVQLGVVILL